MSFCSKFGTTAVATPLPAAGAKSKRTDLPADRAANILDGRTSQVLEPQYGEHSFELAVMNLVASKPF